MADRFGFSGEFDTFYRRSSKRQFTAADGAALRAFVKGTGLDAEVAAAENILKQDLGDFAGGLRRIIRRAIGLGYELGKEHCQ